MEDVEDVPDSVLFPHGGGHYPAPDEAYNPTADELDEYDVDQWGTVCGPDSRQNLWGTVLGRSSEGHLAAKGYVAMDHPGKTTGFRYYPPSRRKVHVTSARSNHQLLLDALARSEAALQAEEAEARARLDKYGLDVWPVGTIITFDYEFGKGAFPNQRGNVYSYAILKSGDSWYSSGPKTPDAKTWEDMIRFWDRGVVSNMQVVKGKKKFRPILPPHIQEEHGNYGVVS